MRNVIGGGSMTWLMDCGIFWLACAAGIVFVIWGFIHEESLIDFEDKVWAATKALLVKFRNKLTAIKDKIFDRIRKGKRKFDLEIRSLNRQKNKKRRSSDGNQMNGNKKKHHLQYIAKRLKSQIIKEKSHDKD